MATATRLAHPPAPNCRQDGLSAAVERSYDGRHTTRTANATRACDGRRTSALHQNHIHRTQASQKCNALFERGMGKERGEKFCKQSADSALPEGGMGKERGKYFCKQSADSELPERGMGRKGEVYWSFSLNDVSILTTSALKTLSTCSRFSTCEQL